VGIKMDEIIKVEKLNKFIKDVNLLSDVSLSIERNSFVTLLGENGAGKTTLLRCLTGLYKIDKGNIYVDGMLWNRKNEKIIKGKLSYIPDKANFDYNLTVQQNIMHHGSLYGISKEITKERSDELFEFFNLSDRKDDIITQYSFGMQKKALIIRGLITEPQILFLDEPTLGLDPKSKEELISELIRLNKTGITIVLTTQSLQIATKSDKVIFVNHGVVRELTGKELYDNAENEVLYINTESLQPHEIDNINQLIAELSFIEFSEVRSHVVEIKMKNSVDYIIKAIETIIKSGIVIYGIEFGSVSLAQLYN